MVEIFQNIGLLIGGLFACAMLLLGALLVGIGLFAMQRHRAAAHWPQAPAVIEKSEVDAERRFEGNLSYRPIVHYRYSTPHGSFVGDKLATTSRLYSKEAKARKVIARYALGSTVMARYNPTDPAEAVLERGVSGGIWFVLFGLTCWIFPVIGAVAFGFSWQVVATVLSVLVLLPTLLLLRSRSSVTVARSRGLYPPAGSGSDADVIALMTRGEKLLAIHLYRELHGVGLKEAKEAVEAMTKNSP